MTSHQRLIEAIDRSKATLFQKRVWKALLRIPRGEVRTYTWLAQTIGSPKAVRAVGNAVGKNPFAPDVPCHRIVRTDGSLGGYSGRGGIQTKRLLIASETLSITKSISSSVLNLPIPKRIEERARSSSPPKA